MGTQSRADDRRVRMSASRRPSWSAALILALLAGLVFAAPQAAVAVPPSGPSSGLAVTVSGSDVLAGGTGSVDVSACNPDGVDLYNATIVIVLPPGVTYVPGSVSPGGTNGLGEPTIDTWIPDPTSPDPDNPATGQVLVWENVADLPAGACTDLSIDVAADPDEYPVGSTFDVGGGVYASEDEREVPTVTVPPTGPPTIDNATEGGSGNTTLTVTPVELTKAETANPENEVIRGDTTPATFEITVTTAPDAGTDSVIVTDLVPAEFQVTSCSGPCTIEIVEIDGEVYTQLTWDLGDIPADTTVTLTYEAFVGLNEITMPDGDPTGDPTRPTGGGYGVTNEVSLEGTYTGDVAPGGTTDVDLTTDETVQIQDLAVTKSSAGGTFQEGETTTFSLLVRASEYIDAGGITITDTIPDGMCPIVPSQTPPVTVTGDAWPAECPAPGTGAADSVTGGTMQSVDYDAATGEFTVVFTLDDLTAGGEVTLDYDVYMRSEYANGVPTATGDTFTNEVGVDGETTPTDGNTVDTGEVTVTDDSSSGLSTDGVGLDKTVWPNEGRDDITGVSTGGDSCADVPAAEYADQADTGYQLGDLVCFRIEAELPGGVATRNIVVTDFPPVGMSVVEWAPGPDNDGVVITGLGTPPETSTSWQLGTQAADGNYYVPAGSTFQLDIVMRVDEVPLTQPTVTGNLAKMRYTTADGSTVSLRDDVQVEVAPAPPITLEKLVDGVDRLEVQEGETVPFTITVQNGEPGSGALPVDSVQVWDQLPPGFTCAMIVTPTSPAYTSCVDGDPTLITWDLEGADLGADGELTEGEETVISYDLVVPSPLSIGSEHTNDAAVVRFTSDSTDGMTSPPPGATYYPDNSLGAYPDEDKNANAAEDDATIFLASATVTKEVLSTDIAETDGTDATIGEGVVWQYSATIPPHTSLFDGVLDDHLPTDGLLVQTGAPTLIAPAGITPIEATGAACDNQPTEFLLCDDGRLFFPETWTNTTDAPVTFTVTLPTRVADVGGNVHGSLIDNTATLDSATAPGGDLILRDEDDAQVTVVEPQPLIAKTADPSVGVGAGTVVTYTLTVGNSGGRSPLYQAEVIDCLPPGLTLDTLGPNMTSAPGTAADCGVGYTLITWTPPNQPILGGEQRIVTYTATVDDVAGAGQTFINTATLTGESAPDGTEDPREYTTSDDAVVTAARPVVTKEVTPDQIVPGETTTWTVSVEIPTDVTVYNAAIVDHLPPEFGGASAVVGTPVLTCEGTDPTWIANCPTGTPLPPSGDDYGLLVGTIPSSGLERTLVMTFDTMLPVTYSGGTDVDALNTVDFLWSAVPATDPTTIDEAEALPIVDSGEATVNIREPLVTVGKSVSDATPGQGEIFTYTVSATTSNATDRDVTAYNVVVVDTVPEGIVPVVDGTTTPLADGEATASGGVWDATARTLTWTIPELAPGTVPGVTFDYDATLAPAAELTGDPLTNTVTSEWDSLPDAGKHYTGDDATATVTPQFPLIDTVKTQVTPANPVYVGDEVTFRVELTNNGGAVATSLDAVDMLPPNWEYVAGSATVQVRTDAPLATEPTVTGDAASGQTLTWADAGGNPVNLQPGETIVIEYRAVSTPDVAVGSDNPHTNTATAADVTDATGGDSYNGGNGSYIGDPGTATAIIHAADLAIDKTAGSFVAGETGTFTIDVTNNGPDPAVGVSVTDTLTLPDGVTFLSAGGPGWTCSAPDASGAFDCDRTDADEALAVGTTWSITVVVAIDADVVSGTQIPNEATVDSRTADEDLTNNTDDAVGEVVTEADLRVGKTDDPDPVVAGEPLSWTVTLTNLGPSVSRGTADDPIVLTDTLPTDQVSDIAIVTGPDECAIAGSDLTCTLPFDLAVGDSITVTFTGTVNADVPGGSTITNSATVAPVTTDPVTDNNTDTTDTLTEVEETLTIDKAIDPVTVTPGEQATYGITVTNGGPSVARGIWVDDTLPPGLTYVDGSVAPAEWTGTPSGSDIRFDYAGELGVGESVTFTYTVDIADDASDPSVLINDAWVSSIWQEDQDEASVGPEELFIVSDLVLDKTVSPTTVIAGEAATYTLTAENLGPSVDPGPVTILDTLPPAVTVVEPLPAGCTATGQILECVNAAGLAVDETWQVTFTVTVDPSFTGTRLANVAVVTSPAFDPTPLNNIDDAILEVIQRANLEVTKTPSSSTVTAGEDLTWDIVVTNSGPSDAQNAWLSDPIPPELALTAAAPDQGTCDGVGTAMLDCDLGTIPAGGSVTVTITTTVDASVPAGTSIDNTATGESTTIDPDTGLPAIDTGTGTIDVVAESQLTLDKVAVEDTVDAGDNAVFRIEVGNTGPSDAAAVVQMVDTLPAGMTFVSASTIGGPDQWDCAGAGQTVTCDLQDSSGASTTLAAGATAPTIEIVALVAPDQPAGVLTNTATATSPTSPEDPTDDADVTVVTRADLGLEKTHDPAATAVAGEPFEWTITVTNHGPSDSVASSGTPITVTDTLPDGVTLAADPASGGPDTTCTEAGAGTVECLRTSTLAAGDSFEITLHVLLDSDVEGEIVNTATVTPGETEQPEDPVWPDTDTDPVTVNEIADLTLTKETETDPVVAGEFIDWTVIVTNLGPSNSDATADSPIVVTDTLPPGVSYVSASGDGWTCAAGAPTATGQETVVCERSDDLPVGEAPPLTITGLVDPSVQGDVTNTAEVDPGLTTDPDPDNNLAEVTDPVTESADLAIVKDISEDIVAGATGRYVITITNNGPSTARAIEVLDTLPDGLTFVSVVPPAGLRWTCATPSDPQQVECDYTGVLRPGASISFEIEVAADAALEGQLTNVAEVSSQTPDPDLSNNIDDVTGELAQLADPSIVKDGPASAEVGDTFTYTLTVSNAGPSIARTVTVDDIVPDALEVVSVTPGAGWTCDQQDGMVHCELPELAPGETAPPIEIEVTVLDAAYPEVTNTAVVSTAAPEDPSTLEDNSSTVTTEVPAQSTLAIEKELTTDLVAGSTATYFLTVTNLGPTHDPGPITVTDVLPDGLTPQDVRLTGADGACSIAGATVTCTLDSLTVGQVATIEIDVLVAAGARGEIVNTATVTSTADPDGDQDSAVGTIEVPPTLPVTGFTSGNLVPLAAALMLAGLALVWAGRRRPAADPNLRRDPAA